MPTLKLAPDDTTIVSPAHRRVWAAPDVHSHSLVVLTLTRLHLLPPTPTPPSLRLVSALEAGSAPDEPLGPAEVIDLRAVRRVRFDLRANAVVVVYDAFDRLAVATIVLDTVEAADGLFTKLWHRLGEGYDLAEPNGADGRGAVAVGAAGIFGALAGGLVVAVAIGGGHAGWQSAAGVCAAGAVGLGLALGWVHRHFARTPHGLDLVRR